MTKQQLLALFAAGIFIATEPAFAAVDEIVVTSRKREEKLQDLPMSVTAFDSATLTRVGIRNLDGVTRYTPGVDLDSGFGLNDQRLVIRGLSPSRGRPNSAVIVDGIDLTTESVSTAGGSMLFSQRLLDIERVEVVKGPQSALYGRAAFTGAIQYITKDPSEELEREAGFDIGEYGRRSVDASIGGALNESIGVRLNVMRWNEDGYYKEGFTNSNLGGGNGQGLSLTSKFESSDTFSARLRVAYSDEEFDQQATLYSPVNTFIIPPANSQVLNSIDEDTIVGLFAGKPADVNGRQPFLTPDPATGKAYPGGEQNVFNSALTLTWSRLGGTITSYSGFVNAENSQQLDGDFDVRPNTAGTMDISRGGTAISFSTDTRIVSQELRYASELSGPLQYTVGLLLWDEVVDQFEDGVSVLAFPFGPSGAPENFFNQVAPITTIIPNIVKRDTNSRSVFGMLEWNVSDAWKISFEGRYAREEMNVQGTGCDPTQDFAVFRCGFSTPDLATEFPTDSGMFEHLERVTTRDRSTDYYFAPRVIVEWSASDELLTYFSVSKGVKPGGIATVASGTWMDQEPDGDLDELKFDAEELVAYELGAKSTLLGNTLTLNGALFYQDYSKKQVPIQTINGGFPFTNISNAGEAEVFGIELETVWQPTDVTRFQLGYTYLDGEYTKLVYQTNSGNSISRAGNCTPLNNNSVCALSLSGNTMEDIPDHSLVALAGYYPALGDKFAGLNGLLEADVKYQDSRFTDEFNDRFVDSHTIVNLRAGVQTDAWDLTLYVDNVFDDDTIQSWSSGTGLLATAERTNPDMTAFPGEGFSIAPPPQHWGIRGNLRF